MAAKPDYPLESVSDPWGMWPAIRHLNLAFGNFKQSL